MRTATYKQAEMIADNDIYEGQSIERYVEQCETTKQPIEGGAPLIFTARKDGVEAQYDIRTDRFKLAQDAMGKVAKSTRAKRAEYVKTQEATGTDGGAESTGVKMNAPTE